MEAGQLFIEKFIVDTKHEFIKICLKMRKTTRRGG